MFTLLNRRLRAPDDPGGAPPPSPPTPLPPPTPSPGTPNPPAPGTSEAKFWEGFTDPALKQSHGITKYASVEELAKAKLNVDKLLGVPAERRLTLPAAEEMSKPEAFADIYRAIGRPDTPDGYAISVADTAPDIVKGFAADLPKELHGLGVTKPAMDKLVEVMNRHAEAGIQAENDAVAADKAAVKAFMQKEFGDNADAVAKDMTELIMKHHGGDATKPEVAAEQAVLRAEIGESLGKMPTFIKFMASLVSERREGAPAPSGDRNGATVIRSLSDATAAQNAFHADPVKSAAWRDASHPLHDAAVAEMNGILRAVVSIKRAGKK